MSGIYHITYLHDDWCKTLLTRDMGDCNCKPEVKFEESKDFGSFEKKMKDDLNNYKKIVSENN